jgi:TPR repeat protein
MSKIPLVMADADRNLFLFVSHVAEDRTAAMEIVGELERRGVPCWIAPRNVRPGRPFDDEIVDAIEDSRAMLLVFSDLCNESEYIRREVTVAGESQKIIIPFRIEDAHPRRGLRVRLSDLHWIDGFAARERAVDQLAEHLANPERLRRHQEGEQSRQQQEEERRPLKAAAQAQAPPAPELRSEPRPLDRPTISKAPRRVWRWLIPIAAIVLFFGFGVGGWWAYTNHQAELAQRDAAARSATEEKERQAAAAEEVRQEEQSRQAAVAEKARQDAAAAAPQPTLTPQLPPAVITAPTPAEGEASWTLDQKREVQRELRALGHYQGEADGGFGAGTRAAIKEFQAFEGHEANGVLSEDERDKLVNMAQQLVVLLDQPPTSPEGVAAATVKGADARYARAWAAEAGKGARQEAAEAAYWYALAAADGDVRAFANLGTIAIRGYGAVKPDPASAVLLWQAAAARGDAVAMYNLGALYERGIDVAADLARARTWYERVAARNHTDARAALKRLGG